MKKKIYALLLAIAMMCTQSVAFAYYGSVQDNFDYNYSYVNKKQLVSQTKVLYFLQLDGLRMDSNGNVSSRPQDLYTKAIMTSNLSDQTRYSDYTVAIGNGITSADVVAEAEKVPEINEAFEKVKDQLMFSGYIRSDKGEVIPWSKLTSKNYGIEWYVLKYELDGWHIDGRIIDLKTSDTIEIVVPDDPKDIPDNAYDEDTDKDTDADKDEKDTSIHLEGAKFAYIFGYEPIIETLIDEDGVANYKAQIDMGMDDNVTVEQVSSMLMRLLDQELYTKDEKYAITPSIKKYEGEWFERGLAYQCAVGGLDSEGEIPLGNISRGLVAKLVSHALKLNLTKDIPFTDAIGNQYEEYIKKVYAYGYMQGISDTEFAPDAIMTRAEFCSLFNKIIGRDKMGLTALDEDGNEFEITAKDYSFIDMNAGHWAYEACLKATSAYDDNGYIDILKRQRNMRNIVDDFNSQKIY